ncbi:MAG TPA: hypothetical protein VGM56_31360 [Byssovorax sp.]|jgi:hypothetical protein
MIFDGAGRGPRRGRFARSISARRGRAAIAACAVVLALATPACTEEDVFVVAPSEPIDASAIDADPVALLPAGPVVLSYVDAAALFKTHLAPSVTELVAAVLPLGEGESFVASRDVARVWSGVYALEGVDFCSVLQGNFDGDAVRRAVASRAPRPGGALVETRYAGYAVYTQGTVGFTIVTSHTALTGTEIGMRRALDRLSRGRLERSVAPWMLDLAKTPNAELALAADLKDDPIVAAAARQIPFLLGLERVRVVGNVRAPGVNLAGAMSYPSRGQADQAAAAVRAMAGGGQLWQWLVAGALGGAPPPIQVGQAENDVGVVSSLDEGLARGIVRAASIFARGVR